MNLATVEMKAFVPARDFAKSKAAFGPSRAEAPDVRSAVHGPQSNGASCEGASPHPYKSNNKNGPRGPVLLLVGAAGFEPTTPCPPGRCATRLRYAPTERA